MDSLTLLEEKNIFHFQERTNYGNAYISSYVQTADGKQRPWSDTELFMILCRNLFKGIKPSLF